MTQQMTKTTEKSVEVYVPFGGQRVDIGEEAAVPAPENPLLQYAIGLSASRPKTDSEGYAVYDEDTGEELVESFNYTGFFTAYGVDKDLDAAMTQLDVPTLTINHNSGPVKHWMLTKMSCFILAKGIPHNANSEGKLGIVYQWRNRRESTKRETVFYVQVMLRHLLPHYLKPFIFTVRSTQTGDALTAFSKQYKVLQRAHEELQKHNIDMPLPLYAYSLVLKGANKQVARGSGEFQKMIYPLISLVPDTITGDYLQKQEMPLEYADLLRDATNNAVEWSMALSQRIASGGEPSEPWANNGSSESTDHPF